MELIRRYRSLDRVAKLYLGSQLLRALYFAWPAWYGFASLALTPVQIGFYFSMVYAVQLCSEVPTGAFADKFGRRRSALIGGSLLVLLPLVLYFGHNFAAYMVGAVLSGVGLAFISGSLEALVYDHHNVSKNDFRTISWLEISFYQIGLIVSTALGGFLYDLHHSIPFLCEAVATAAGVMLIARMEESRRNDSEDAKASGDSYWSYFRTGLRHLLASVYLRVVVLIGVLVGVGVTMCIEYVNEAQMIEYGLTPTMRGLLLASVKVLSLVVLNVILYRLLHKDRARLVFIATVGTAIFLTLSISSLPLFLTGFIMFNWLSATQGSFIRPILHDLLPSSHRATALSGFSALIGLVSFGAYSLGGALIEYFQTPRAVYLGIAGLFVLVIIPATWWLLRHLKRDTDRQAADA